MGGWRDGCEFKEWVDGWVEGWVSLQKLITDLDMRNGYKGGVRFSSLMKYKKRAKLRSLLLRRKKIFFLFMM
jgi:hypothetical protein